MHFFALSVTTSLKIPGAVIPRRVFTRPGTLAYGGGSTKPNSSRLFFRQWPVFQCSRKNATETALAGVGGFELSNPEKPPLEHGLTATEGRSARHIHCRKDWTGVQVTLWQLSR